MATFKINAGYNRGFREVEADAFATVGDYIDFVRNGEVVLRLRATAVEVIERTTG